MRAPDLATFDGLPGCNYNVITMKLELTRIGNSRGIRIPKPLIAQCGLGDVVEIRVTPEGLVIAPNRAPRQFDGSDWKW